MQPTMPLQAKTDRKWRCLKSLLIERYYQWICNRLGRVVQRKQGDLKIAGSDGGCTLTDWKNHDGFLFSMVMRHLTDVFVTQE